MSKLSEKINHLRDELSTIESELEAAEAKLYRQSFKRRRKHFRKKMCTDPTFKLLARLERDMFGSELSEQEPGTIIATLLDICK